MAKTTSVMTVTCARCDHLWATEAESLSPDLQEKVRETLLGLQ